MTVERLDHINIRTSDLEATKRFFVDVLGLTEGWRPPFNFPGAWLYCGEQAVVHLVGTTASGNVENAALDHFAFYVRGFDGVVSKLKKHGYRFEARVVPDSGRRQIFMADPNGVRVELNFPSAKEEALAA
jgi:catechol 2,3-dioxygenase-like lactoylglutathione lyase family enzyme